MTRRREQIILAARVEGLGDADGLTLWATRAPVSSEVTVRPVLEALPGELSSEVDWRDGSASVGGVRLDLRATQDALDAFYDQEAPTRLGLLGQQLSADEASAFYDHITIAQDDAGANLVGDFVMVGREAVRCTSPRSTGTYGVTYGAERGQLGTAVTFHGALDGDDREVFAAGSRLLWPTMRELQVVQLHLATGAPTILERYVLTDIEAPRPSSIALTADSALEMVRARRLCERLWRGRLVSATAPDAPDPSAAYEGAGLPASGWARWQGVRYGELLVSVGGEAAVRTVWAEGITGAQVRLLGTEDLLPGSRPWQVEDLGVEEVWECFSSSPAAPPLAVDGSTVYRLASNVIDLVQQLLSTTAGAGEVAPGTNGPYDLGIPQLGCGVPRQFIDENSFDRARLEIAADPTVESLFLGVDGEPVEALDLIQDLLRPYGYLLASGQGGLLGLRRLTTAVPDDAPQITDADLREEVSQRRRLGDPADVAVAEWGDRAGVGPRTATFSDQVALSRQAAGAHSTDLWLRAVSSYDVAESVAIRWIRLWRLALPEWSLACGLRDDLRGLRAGDVVSVTSSQLIGRKVGGHVARGVTAEAMVVTSATQSWGGAQVQLRGLWTGVLIAKRGRIAPSAQVASVLGAAITIAANTYSSSLMEGQTDDTFGFEVGFEVEVRSADLGTSRGTATISTIVGLVITLDAAPSGVVAGDVLRLAPYDAQVSAARAEYAFLADASGVGASNAPPYEWVF